MKTIEISCAEGKIICAPSDEKPVEFYANEGHLHFADGTVMQVGIQHLTDVSRIMPVKAGTAAFARVEAIVIQGDTTDKVILWGDALWLPGTNTAAPIECWNDAEGPNAEELGGLIFDSAEYDLDKLPMPEALAFYRAARLAGAIR